MPAEELKIKPLDKLCFSSFNFTAEAFEYIYIPEFKGSAFHSGFGKAFNINLREKFQRVCIEI